MNIDQKLNMVIPIEEDRGTVYVHAEPIGAEVFERYFMPIAKTFSAIYSGGLGITAGPRVAALLLRRIAREDGALDGPEGVEAGLFTEITRLANVISKTATGWQPIPLEQAIKENVIDQDSAREVENALVFFTVLSSMHRRSMRRMSLESACELWAAQIVSSNCTAFAASLPTPTGTVSSGEKAPASSIPS